MRMHRATKTRTGTGSVRRTLIFLLQLCLLLRSIFRFLLKQRQIELWGLTITIKLSVKKHPLWINNSHGAGKEGLVDSHFADAERIKDWSIILFDMLGIHGPAARFVFCTTPLRQRPSKTRTVWCNGHYWKPLSGPVLADNLNRNGWHNCILQKGSRRAPRGTCWSCHCVYTVALSNI